MAQHYGALNASSSGNWNVVNPYMPNITWQTTSSNASYINATAALGASGAQIVDDHTADLRKLATN